MVETGAASTRVSLDLAIYSISAIQKAAYRFAHRCAISLESDGPSRVEVVLTPLKPGDETRSISNALLTELLDQNLRELVANETAPIRDLILAQAFSNFPLVDPAGETGDSASDPIGITALRTEETSQTAKLA
jgi:His-Xaa-Ser system protein HxsD